MRVKLLIGRSGVTSILAGTILDVPPDEAKLLIDAGKAEKVEEPEYETAMAPASKSRKKVSHSALPLPRTTKKSVKKKQAKNKKA